MSNRQDNQKRIAKNTMILYIMTLLVMLVSLYTSRVVLSTLGVNDFGIYDVVGGIITMMGFIQLAMSTSIQRNLNFAMGRADIQQVNKVFCLSVNIHILIALAVLVVGETVGLWFLNNKMVVPADRMVAANWVYQFSILAMMVNITQSPYMAVIMANEKMGQLAYFSIFTVVLKLLIVYILLIGTIDKLILYSILTFGVTLLMSILYRVYCIRRFAETKYRFLTDKKIFRELAGFAGWDLLANLAVMFANQGQNMILNLFFGPVVNAAKGISSQVNSAILTFITNFQTASRPQLIKSYAAGEKEYFHSLTERVSTFSFYLMFTLAAPILIETGFVLNIWLNIVPDYSVMFCRLVIINSLISTWANPLVTAAHASGKMKKFTIYVTPIVLLNLPITYLLLRLGFNPTTPIYVTIFISFFSNIVRLVLLKKIIHFNMWSYIRNVILKCIIIAIIIITPLLIIMYTIGPSFVRFLTILIVSIGTSITVIYFIGLLRSERLFVKTHINKFIKQKLTWS